MPDLRDFASNLHAALLRREFSARDLLGSTLAAIARRKTSPRELRVALWLDESFVPVDATAAAAVRTAALMLEQAVAIADESERPAFSIEEACEVFAVLAHALIGAGLPKHARDKLAPANTFF
ncbi:MAG: hypothetical protein ACREDG_02625 [Methylocella sp.]